MEKNDRLTVLPCRALFTARQRSPLGGRLRMRLSFFFVLLQKWLDHNSCPFQPQLAVPVGGKPGARDADHRAIRYTYAPCRGGTEVVLWKLSGAGHVWPGGQENYLPLLLGASTTVIDANSEMWRFFSRFRRESRSTVSREQ